MKLLKPACILILLCLTACYGNSGFTEERSSLVISSGPYRQPYQKENKVLEYLTGEKSVTNGIMYFNTNLWFEKDDNSGEKFRFNFLTWQKRKQEKESAGERAPFYYPQFVTPGKYVLTGYQLGNLRIHEYNSEVCGKISVEVLPNEIVYIGGLKPGQNQNLVDNTYKHAVPEFEDQWLDLQNHQEELVEMMAGKDKELATKLLPTKKFVTRLPTYEMAEPPEECNAIAVPLWERL